jgi:hypothetical protein
LSQEENQPENEDLSQFIRDNEIIFRIGGPKKSVHDKLQLLILKLLIILWEQGEEEDLEEMEEKLKIIDDVRHELTFLRAKYYKDIFSKRAGLSF